MRFLLDMNLPPAIADRLRAEGHDAIHALDAGFSNLSDHELFERDPTLPPSLVPLSEPKGPAAPPPDRARGELDEPRAPRVVAQLGVHRALPQA